MLTHTLLGEKLSLKEFSSVSF